MRRPCSSAVDDGVGTECPLGCPHGPDPVGFDVESDHLDAALDRGACGFGRLREPMDCTMLVQVAVGSAVAASCEAEFAEDWPACQQVFRIKELAWDAELVLELDLVAQDLKLSFIGS